MAWAAVIGAVAGLSYWARLSGDGAEATDLLFRWVTAIATVVFDGLILLLLLAIARGLPLRDTFALRRPPSWRQASLIALGALLATYTVSIAEEIFLGHAAREQAVPQFWDGSRADAFAANAFAIAVLVPIVEEAACRGLGFRLLERYGQGVAIVGSAIAFALAHGAITDLPWVLVTGLGLGFLRSRTGSLYPCVALHAFVNGVAVLVAATVAPG